LDFQNVFQFVIYDMIFNASCKLSLNSNFRQTLKRAQAKNFLGFNRAIYS